jgi:hypothetical protein
MSDGGQVGMQIGRDPVEPTNIVGEAALLANPFGVGFPGTTAPPLQKRPIVAGNTRSVAACR